ncbi:MAG: leucyl aminopeptidase [Ideonella sp.]|nr:leucyl aminopeptidase [Ideonella sp.]MBE7427343.1 leucyl aminopeptidase [Ideonella sp.]MCC7459379.1 leucyl aminopeptidase [Nitrospira sp.]
MDFRHQAIAPTGVVATAADALLVVIVAGAKGKADLPRALNAALQRALKQGDLALEGGRCLYLGAVSGVKAPRVVLAVAADASPRAVKAAFVAGLAQLKALGSRHLAVWLHGAGAVGAGHAEALTQAAGDAVYLYRHTKPSAGPAPKLGRVTLLCARADEASVAEGTKQGAAIAAGVKLARELANRPGNHCTPSQLAEQAQELARQMKLKVQVLGRKEIEQLGMGALLAVSQGSEQPPRFIVLGYQGAAASAPPVVLVGKGITFDSGGISIKPAAEMDEMKFDMGGAASVLGTLRAVAQLKPAINLVGLIAACENLPSGRAVKPGDVVTSLSGKTIEILNTDAEGRLILCDALSYAERLAPRAVVDIATLTGACVIALGHHRSGLFTPHDALAESLGRAGDAALDPCWRMPLDAEYDEALKTSFADVANVGPRAGGAITAAMFLKRFAAKLHWAHLDIAGTAWKTGANKGATGRPVGLLTHYVLEQARAA